MKISATAPAAKCARTRQGTTALWPNNRLPPPYTERPLIHLRATQPPRFSAPSPLTLPFRFSLPSPASLSRSSDYPAVEPASFQDPQRAPGVSVLPTEPCVSKGRAAFSRCERGPFSPRYSDRGPRRGLGSCRAIASRTLLRRGRFATAPRIAAAAAASARGAEREGWRWKRWQRRLRWRPPPAFFVKRFPQRGRRIWLRQHIRRFGGALRRR